MKKIKVEKIMLKISKIILITILTLLLAIIMLALITYIEIKYINDDKIFISIISAITAINVIFTFIDKLIPPKNIIEEKINETNRILKDMKELIKKNNKVR